MSIKASIYTKYVINSLLLLLAVVLSSCDILYDEGEWTQEQRQIREFETITINCIADINYFYSDTCYLEIFYYQKHIKNIKTLKKQRTLTIKNSFNGQWFTDLRNPQIHIYAPALSSVTIKDAAGFYCMDTIQTTRFAFNMQGDVFESKLILNTEQLRININNAAGNLYITGKSNEGQIFCEGETYIDATQTAISSLNITQQSSRNAEIWVTDYLNYKIIRNGNLIVTGTPEHEGIVLGNGEIIWKANE